jgi:hypothetical protein
MDAKKQEPPPPVGEPVCVNWKVSSKCKNTKVKWMADPYTAEMSGVYVWKWMCERCALESYHET